jgi:competence protein ComEC
LVAGDCLWVNGSFEPAPAYLQKQSVAATGFVRSEQWSTIASTHVPFSLKLYGLSIRRILLKQLRQIVPGPDAFAIAAALMLGYRNELDANLQQSFRNIGASHILAISGAHFAILFGMLYFMLSFLGNSPKAKRLKQIIFIPLIWYFAFLTGFSPSVVRASAMLTIWGMGELLGCRAFTYNTIAVAAFFMLLLHPLYLFDVSFQLSFMAVIAILVISPRLAKGYESKNRIIHYVWQLTCVSLAAQIGVLPLSVYYFHQFPVFFLLTNFCLIPLMSVLLFFIPLSMILSAVFGNISWMLFPLRQSLQWFIDITEELNALPFRTIDNLNLNLDLDLQGMIVSSLCIICLLLVWIRKRMVYFCYLLILLLVQWIF